MPSNSRYLFKYPHAVGDNSKVVRWMGVPKYNNVFRTMEKGKERLIEPLSIRKKKDVKPISSITNNTQQSHSIEVIDKLIGYTTERYHIGKKMIINGKSGEIVYCSANNVGTSDGSINRFEICVIVKFDDGFCKDIYSLGELSKWENIA